MPSPERERRYRRQAMIGMETVTLPRADILDYQQMWQLIEVGKDRRGGSQMFLPSRREIFASAW